jgi:N-acetylglucosaminyl-diphospho-decaprenol L-rhamnosyltransferase
MFQSVPFSNQLTDRPQRCSTTSGTDATEPSAAAPATVAGSLVDVSVCIANWNCRAMLRDCLQSLHGQSQGVRLETIVVDNGSSDGAADMVACEFPEVILVRNASNRGFSCANNQAARQARGRYLFFLNNDTVVPEETLATLMHYLEVHPQVGIVGPRLRDGQGRTQVSYRRLPTVGAFLHRTCLLRWTGLFRGSYRRFRCCRRRSFRPTHPRRVPVLLGAAMLMRRTVFQECGGWNEEYVFGGEDMELCRRVGERRPLVYHPHVEIVHYGRVSTRLNAAYSMPNTAIGYVRSLRASGTGPAALLAYKIIVTLDAPVHLGAKLVQYLWRRLRGHTRSAEKSLLAAQGSWYFLCKGLIPFWKA